ncbi:MAG: NAD(P)H-hydrate dehydratase [Candidatus Rokuibacteriota bacterium]
MRPVFTADEMRRLDARAISSLGIPGAVLMEHAGRGAAEAIAEFLGHSRRRARVDIVCGKGGNGGDGFVAARWLRRAGLRPAVWLTSPASEIRGDPARKLAELRRAGIRPRLVDDEDTVGAHLHRADVIVDALLGTGAKGAPSGLIKRMIELINASGRPVIALDVPSGAPADAESPPGPAIRATLTVTFAGLKRGLVMGPGADLAGQVRVIPIGIPASEVERGITTYVLEATDAASLFPDRPRQAHKGTYGHLLVVGGSRGKTGAAVLAARAAMRTGAGLVTVATPASQQPIVASLLLESMSEALDETRAGTIAPEAAEAISRLAAARDAVALGPGLGLEPQTREVARRLVGDLPQSMVIDADALSALAGHLDILARPHGPRCLTPHPGEMARVLGVTVADVERDRIACVGDFVRAYGVHLVLKGATSVVGDPDGRIFLNPTGNPGMASGGMGDVLTGMVGALLARRSEPGAALRAAVYVHGLAGDLAATTLGQESLIAGDLIDALPQALRALRGSAR